MSRTIGKPAAVGSAILLIGHSPRGYRPWRHRCCRKPSRATIVNGTVDSDHAGFTGTGFVNSAKI